MPQPSLSISFLFVVSTFTATIMSRMSDHTPTTTSNKVTFET